MIPQEFWQPWSEIDPTLRHGGIPDGLTGFVAARLGDNPRTCNADLKTIFSALNDAAAALSMHPEADREGPPLRNLVEETLRALNWILERIQDRTKTTSTAFFMWTHATPPLDTLKVRPIRFPLRSTLAHSAVYYLLGTMVETAENNASSYHSGLDPSSAHRIIAPLLHLKANIIRDWFDQEVSGEISLTELMAIFEGVSQPGPTIVPQGQSMPLPDAQRVQEALAGVDLIQWYPSDEHWTIFGRKSAVQFKPERIWQPEATQHTTEDVSPGPLDPPSSPLNPG